MAEGAKAGKKKESYRKWLCPGCGTKYDSPLPVVQVRCGDCSKKTDRRASSLMKPDLSEDSTSL